MFALLASPARKPSLFDAPAARKPAPAPTLRAGKIFWGGGWIMIQDRATGADIKGFNFPKAGPTEGFIRRVLKWCGQNGVVLCVGQGMGGGVCLMLD